MGFNHFRGYIDPTADEALLNIERTERARRCLTCMPLVYICSPFRGEVGRNCTDARRYCAFAVEQKVIPIAPHLLFPQFMDDETPEERELAIHMELILLGHCKEIWYFGDRISTEMKRELKRALARGIRVRHFTDDCTEVPA